MKKYLPVLFVVMSSSALAHTGEKHDDRKTPKNLKAAPPGIAENYLSQVKPIFEKKCFDCHGSTTKFPWYYQIPGVKQFIDQDIKEAKEHLDMSRDFPFKGHGSPKEDLEAIKKTLEEGSMPPLLYRLAHPGSTLTPDEFNTVINWVNQSLL